MNTVRLVVLGGSGIATPELARALAALDGRESAIKMVLVGRNESKLEIVGRASALEAARDPLLSVSWTTDRGQALDGADIVLNQIRVGGMRARAFDETYSRELGTPGEETVGAGGFANASRTIPVVLEYCREVEERAPQARFLTFSNPASVVQYAISRYTSLDVVGMCDAPISLRHEIAEAAGVGADELTLDYVGMHHFGFATGIWHEGHNLLPDLLADPSKAVPNVEPSIIRGLGALPGHYFNYYFHPDRMLAAQGDKPARGGQLAELQDDILQDMAQANERGERSSLLATRKAVWYRAIIAPVVASLTLPGAPARRVILNVRNDGIVPWLPAEAIVEVPTIIAGGRIQPLAVGSVPGAVRGLIQANAAYEMQAVEAIVERDPDKAVAALLLNPMIQNYDQARAVVDRAWQGAIS